jgi:FkbM family methyltransferase
MGGWGMRIIHAVAISHRLGLASAGGQQILMKKLHWSLLKRLYRLGGRFSVATRLQRRWLLDNRNWIDQQLLIRRPYEVGQIARCRQFIREHRLERFYDIGANFGLYSVLLSDEASLAEMHAFEPLPRNAHQLGANLYLNGLDSRVTVHNLALSDRDGQLDLFVDPHSTGVSTLMAAQLNSRQEAYRTTLKVETRRFDDLFSSSGIRALMKMDVEGAELMVLAGMKRFLSENQIVLQVETMPDTLERVAAYMSECGYREMGRLGADAYYGNI